MLPIKIAIDLLCGGGGSSNNNAKNNNNSSSSFRFDTLHDHQVSQALKSIVIACYTSPSLCNDAVTSLFDVTVAENSKNQGHDDEKVLSSLSNLCFFLLTVGGNDDVFLIDNGADDDLATAGILGAASAANNNNNNQSNNASSSSLSAVEKRRRASCNFLRSFFSVSREYLAQLQTKKVVEKDEDRFQKIFQLLSFFDSFFDFWFRQCQKNDLVQKTFVKNGHRSQEIRGIFKSKEFNESVIGSFIEQVLSISESSSLCLSASMSLFQFYRLLSTMNLIIPSSNLLVSEASSTSKLSHHHQFPSDQLMRSFSSSLEMFRTSMMKSNEPSLSLMTMTTMMEQNNKTGWTLLDSAINAAVQSIEKTNFISLSIRLCEALLEGSRNTYHQQYLDDEGEQTTTHHHHQSSRGILIECVKRWKELNSSSKTSAIETSLEHVLFCDAVKLGLCRGGDVALRILAVEQEDGTNDSNSTSYSNSNAFILEAIDILFKIVEKASNNSNQNDAISALLLNLMIVLATPIIAFPVIIDSSNESTTASTSGRLPCHLTVDHLNRLLVLLSKNNNNTLIIKPLLLRLISFIVVNKPQLAIPYLFREHNNNTTAEVENYVFDIIVTYNNNKNDHKNEAQQQQQHLHHHHHQLLIERMAIESKSQKWISLIKDTSLRTDLMMMSFLLLREKDDNNDSNTTVDDDDDATCFLISLFPKHDADSISLIVEMARKLESENNSDNMNSNHDRKLIPKNSQQHMTPADIMMMSTTNKDDNNNRDNNNTHSNNSMTSLKQKTFQAALKKWILSATDEDGNNFIDTIIINLMKNGILQNPGSPLIVSVLGSEEVKKRLEEEIIKTMMVTKDDSGLKCFLQKELFSFHDQNHQKSSSTSINNNKNDPLHCAISPLICLRLLVPSSSNASSSDLSSSSSSSSLLLDTLFHNVFNDIDNTNHANKNNDDDDDHIASPAPTSDDLAQSPHFWRFPEYRKMVADILTALCSSSFSSASAAVEENNLERVTSWIHTSLGKQQEEILLQNQSTTASSSLSIDEISTTTSLRFLMLLSCQLILSTSTFLATKKKLDNKNNKKKSSLHCVYRLSIDLAEASSKILESITTMNKDGVTNNSNNNILFQATTDSLAISLFGCIICRCLDGVTYDRVVYEWMKFDTSFINNNQEEDEPREFIVPLCQHNTAKSIILMAKRELFDSVFAEKKETEDNASSSTIIINPSQIWNALGAPLTSSLLHSIAISISKKLVTDDNNEKQEDVEEDLKQKSKLLSLQLISAISVLSNTVCLKFDDDRASFYGQCLFNIMTVFANGAERRYGAEMQNEIDDDVFSALLKMMASILAAATTVVIDDGNDDDDENNKTNNKQQQRKVEGRIKALQSKLEICSREREKIIGIINTRREGKDKKNLFLMSDDDIELAEFILEMMTTMQK